MPKIQPENIAIKLEKQEGNDIVFLEEKPSSTKNEKKYEVISTNVQASIPNRTITSTDGKNASFDNIKEASEFNYSQDNEEIEFDSDDELISVFEM